MCIDTIPKNCFADHRVESKILNAGFERKTTYSLQNSNKKTVSKVCFDLCIGPDESCCDYLFIIEDEKLDKYIFIELKDSKILKAIKQINSSLDKYQLCLTGKDVHGRIITTKTHAPTLKTSEYKNLKKRLKGNLITRTKQYEEVA